MKVSKMPLKSAHTGIDVSLLVDFRLQLFALCNIEIANNYRTTGVRTVSHGQVKKPLYPWNPYPAD